MKKFLLLLIFFSTVPFYAQVGIGTTTPDASAMLDVQSTTSGILIPRMSASERDNIASPATGLMVYVNDDNTFYYYNGSVWKKLSDVTQQITFETISIGSGNQTINVRDADKIIGFTLMSSFNSIANNIGKMVGTWMIYDDRDIIRCHLQMLEQPYMKFLNVSVKIDNANNTIEFTNYTSRYWKITETLPQGSLSNHQTNYRLGKIIIIRKE